MVFTEQPFFDDPLACRDCHLPYSDPGYADFVVSDEVWAKLTAVDGASILCAMCMVRRGELLGIVAEGRFTSGPFADHDWKKPRA